MENLISFWKPVSLLSHFDTLNFRKFYKVVWISLEPICKRYGRKRKQKKEKRRKKINKKGQGAPFRPSRRSSPWPISFTSRTGTLALSLFHWQVEPPDRWDRLVRSSSTSGRPLRKLPRLSRYSLPSSIPFMAYLNRRLATAIKTPRAPPPPPFRPPAREAARPVQFIAGVHSICEPSARIRRRR
jgi:hypothetical protein